MDFQIINQNGIFPDHLTIGSSDLYFPTPNSRISLRNEIERHLRSKYTPGTYEGQAANEVSQHLFSFYNSELRESIKLIDETYFIYFTLFNLDKATRVQYQFRSNQLFQEDKKFWQEKGPLYRRTLSYLLDEMIANFEFPEKQKQPYIKSLIDYDRLFLLTEKSINYSIISNEIYFLNKSYKIKINPPGHEYFLESIDTKASNKYSEFHKYYLEQTAKDTKLKEQYIQGKLYENDWEKHAKFLNLPFKDTIGLSYNEFMYLITSIILNTKEINSENDIPMVNKDEFLNDITIQLNINKDQIQNFFEGLILRKEHFVFQERLYSKYKQMYRIGKRPILEIKKTDGTYLTWSNEMLKERLDFLDNDFIFKTLPKEWNNKKISIAVNKISNDAGKWFENQVKQNLNSRGIVGEKIKDKILTGKNSLNCRVVGGFDFLGYSFYDNLIILIECKYINPGFEPRSYYDDLKTFTNSRNGYIMKLDRKLEWLKRNFEDLKSEIGEKYSIRIPDSCSKVGTAFITYVNTFAFAFIKKYPTVSFSEFFENYDKQNKWYLKKGIIKIKV